jgi:hypothetical protein
MMPLSLFGWKLAAHSTRPILTLLCLASASALLVAEANPSEVVPSPVLSMREFALKPGISAADFEQFVRGEMAQTVAKNVKGMKIKILKGDRGDRKGAYSLVWEFDSVTTRNQFFPREGGLGGPPFDEAWEHIKPVMGKFKTFVKDLGDYTDYVVVSE